MIEDRKRVSSGSSGGDTEAQGWAYLLWGSLAFVAAVMAIPASIGYFLFKRFGKHLVRWQYVTMMLVGLALAASSWPRSVSGLFKWVANLMFGFEEGNRFLNLSLFPLASIISLTLFFFGLIGLIGAETVGRLTSRVHIPGLSRKSILDDTDGDIMATATEIANLSDAGDLESIVASSFNPEDPGFVIGVDQRRQPVYITEREIGMHMLAFGGTGSGKTVSLQVIAGGLLDLGWSGLIVDLKEDTGAGGLREWCETYAHSHGTAYQELALSSSDPKFWFNPLAGLGVDEARDSILALTRFDDDYYKNVSIKVLTQVLNLIYWARAVDPVKYPEPSLHQVAEIMSSPDIIKKTGPMRYDVVHAMEAVDWSMFDTIAITKIGELKQARDANNKPVFNQDGSKKMVPTYKESPNADKVFATQAASWGAKIGNLFETQAGKTILKPDGTRQLIDVTVDGLTYIGLDSTSKLDLSKVVSASVLQRISVDAAQRTTGQQAGPKQKKFIIVDEASVADRKIIHALLSKARSAGIAVILATQGPLDWVDRDGDDFAKLAQNTNVALIMNQGEPESAQLCADYIGQRQVIQANLRYVDGEVADGGSIREGRDYIVQPDELRTLQIGQGIVRVGKPSAHHHWVKVIPRDPRRGATHTDHDPAPSTPPLMPPSTPGIARPPGS